PGDVAAGVACVGIGDDIRAAATIMVRHRVRTVFVVDGGRVAGVVTRNDLLEVVTRSLATHAPPRFGCILACPPDDAPEAVVRVAQALAQRDGARLVGLYVVPRAESVIDSAVATAVIEHAGHQRRAACEAWLSGLVRGAS